MAYSALFILIGTMNPTPSDSLAIFLLELHDGLPLPCATAMGTAIAVILISSSPYTLYGEVEG